MRQWTLLILQHRNRIYHSHNVAWVRLLLRRRVWRKKSQLCSSHMDMSMAAVPFVSGQCVQRQCLQTLFVTAHVSQREQETVPYVVPACLERCENHQPSSNSAMLMNTQDSETIRQPNYTYFQFYSYWWVYYKWFKMTVSWLVSSLFALFSWTV